MFNTAHLEERVPLRYCYFTFFYRFRENFVLTSRITAQYLKTQPNPNNKSPVGKLGKYFIELILK